LDRPMKMSRSEPTLSVGGSGFRVVKKQQEYPWTRSPALEPLYSNAFEKTYVDQQETQSRSHQSSFQETCVPEPAPEPRLGMSLTKFEGFGLDAHGDAEVSEENLRTQMSAIESQLMDLDGHWQAVDRERHALQLESAELSRNLTASRDREVELDTELRATQRNLEEAMAEVRLLKKNMATLEGESATLRSQRDALEHREGVVGAQVDSLHASLYDSRSKVEELQQRLDQKEQERTMIAELLRETEDAAERRKVDEAVLQRPHESEQAADSMHRRIRDLEAEVNRQREGEASADSMHKRIRELEAEVDRHGKEEAMQTQLRNDLQSKLLQADTGLSEAQRRVAAAEATQVQLQQAAKDSEARDETAFWEDLLESSAPSSIPELLFVEELTEPSKATSSSSGVRLVPASCRIELGSKQLSLQMLGPVGGPRSIALVDVECIDRSDSNTGVVDLDIRPSVGAGAASAATKPERLRLVALDEHAASAFVAAILPDRVVPGCNLGSPLP